MEISETQEKSVYTPEAATRYLHEHIPLSRAMEVTIQRIGAEMAELTAPLAPNINHRHTVFGGSIASVATLAVWSYIHFRLRAELGFPCRVVIAKSATDFLLPVEGDFAARCVAPDEEVWRRFKEMIRRHGKGRITLDSSVSAREEGAPLLTTFTGTFVALKAGDEVPELK